MKLYLTLLACIITTVLQAQEIRKSGSIFGYVQPNGDVRISGSIKGKFETNGDIRVNGSIRGKVERSGTIRKNGSMRLLQGDFSTFFIL